jgi:hypothetical protein
MSLAAWLAACGGSSGPTDAMNDGPRPMDVADSGDTVDVVASDVVLANVRSILIAPVDAHLDITDGMPASLVYHVTALLDDGTTQPLTRDVQFSVGDPRFGTIVTTGLFQSAGIGGTTTISAYVAGRPDLFASTSLTVTVHRTFIATGAPITAPMQYGSVSPTVDPMLSPQIVYPLDEAVMPRNVLPPQVHWYAHHTAAAGDIYRVRLEKTHATYDCYLRAGSISSAGFVPGSGDGYAWTVDSTVWRTVVETDVGEPMHISVAIVSTPVLVSSSITVTAVNSIASGSVYYWSIGGVVPRIPRLDTNTGMSVDPLPNPDVCVGCHVVSRDGRRMALGSMFDITTVPATVIGPGGGGRSASFNPDTTRVLTVAGSRGHPSGPMVLLDATGNILPASGLPSLAGEVEWSPDGASVAYSNTSLFVMPALAGDAFGPARTVYHIDPTDPQVAVGWPTWSPDGRRIVFDTIVDPVNHYPGLSIISSDGGPRATLDRVNAPGTMNYRSRYTPFDSGGYQWVVFSSVRNYGVPQLGADQTVKQLWVTAIRSGTSVSSDVASVPYWLTGQNRANSNFSAYWVVPSCRGSSERCGSSADCCSANCEMATTTDGTCVAATTCRGLGDTCGADADCCAGTICTTQHFCSPPGL